jgi:uncharacterized protein (DUF488 family)
MWNESGVVGIGYEGESLDSLIRKLKARNIGTVFDVRLNAISLKRGFSKTALSTALHEEDIEYVHTPALGNPKANRDGYSERPTTDGDAARATFRGLLIEAAAAQALDDVVRRARTTRVALFCFDANELHCHREQVLEAARARHR